MMSAAADAQNLVPVILGGDVGAYTLGLECYEAFGVKSICVAAAPVDMITKSIVFDVEQVRPHASDAELLAVLNGLAAMNEGKQLLLLANTDGHISFFAKYRKQLEAYYLLPFPTAETIELLGDKVSFAQVCGDLGVPTPQTIVVDFADADSDTWAAPEVNLQFPVVAKTASGAAYDRVTFDGKKKIWFITEREQLEDLWSALKDSGFRDRFIVQENIPGDDTCMRSLTFYVGRNGKVLLRSAAHVLLQDPSPTLIGNPVAMITGEQDELWEMGEKILAAGNYSGFANFDIKVDPRDGTPYFLEVNPRIGRNSYYVVAAGANPMEIMVRDLWFGQQGEPVDAAETALYSLVSLKLIRDYVSEGELVETAEHLAKEGRMINPLESPLETSKSRRLVAQLQKLNYLRKFRKYSPEIAEVEAPQ